MARLEREGAGADGDRERETERVAAAVTRVADEYVREFQRRFPDRAELQGIPLEQHDGLADYSPEGLSEWHRIEDDWSTAIDQLDASMLRGRPEWVTLGFLREAIESSRRLRICRNELWAVNHLSGWQADLAQVAEMQPVATDRARDEALARWSMLPRYLDTEIDNLREGLRLGFSTPQRPVLLVIEQLDSLLGSEVETWPFYSPAERDGSSGFHARWRALLTEVIAPAIERYRTYLRQEYVQNAREALSITAHPDGEACYQAAFRASTTIDRPAAETYALGLDRVERNLNESLELGRRRLGTGDLPTLVARINDARENRFESPQAMLDFAKSAVARARDRVPGFFHRRPHADVVIEPYPAFLERDAVDDSYWPATDDDSRPARYLIALFHFASATRSNAEITAYHEAYPGHHLEAGLARERTTAHPITKLVSNDGFVEGWARYAETLAEEMGLYASDFALASRRVWPSRGMVVDPGIHLFDWSRERAAAFMAESGRLSPEAANATVDRIAVWPGQFASYDTGGLEIFDLRRQAERSLGDRFDLRDFHDAVLANGAVTLPMLRDQVERWIVGGGGAIAVR